MTKRAKKKDDSMKILTIDPGNEESAYVIYDTETKLPTEWGMKTNPEMRQHICQIAVDAIAEQCVIEYTPPYTMTTQGGHSFVPNQVVLTAIELGRFIQVWEYHNDDGDEAETLSRIEIKKHMLGRATGNDSHITQAILERYGGTREQAVGRKASPGPLYGVKKDVWAALAVAITWSETNELSRRQDQPAF